MDNNINNNFNDDKPIAPNRIKLVWVIAGVVGILLMWLLSSMLYK